MGKRKDGTIVTQSTQERSVTRSEMLRTSAVYAKEEHHT